MPKFTDPAIQQILEYAYDKAFEGFPGTDSAMELAQSFKEKYPGDKLKQADALINRQIAAGATSGLLTELNGLMVFPVAIPVSLATTLFIQVRMIMAIAIIGGYDLKDSKVKALALSCFAGNTIKDMLNDSEMEASKKVILKTVIDAILVAGVGKIAKSLFILQP